jgi:hypothetical protein
VLAQRAGKNVRNFVIGAGYSLCSFPAGRNPTMNQRLLALLLVAGASVVAAGGGAYVALRQDTAPAAASVPTDTLSDQAASSLPMPEAAVHETEAVIASPSGAPTGADARSKEPATTSARASRPARGTSPAEPVATARRVEVESRPAAVPGPRPTGTPVKLPPTEARPPRAERPAATVAAEPQELPGNLPDAQPIEPVPAPAATVSEVPARVLQELTVPGESVIGLQVENSITSEHARIEDRVEARVTRDVRVDGRVAIPAGSRMLGSVTLVDRGGKVKERARLGIRFHTLVLADGVRVPVQTEAIYREGESPSGESAAKIGGAAVGGAILGAILGGGKGAAIGGSIGAAGGTAAVMASDRNPAELQAGSTVTVRLQGPVTVTVED